MIDEFTDQDLSESQLATVEEFDAHAATLERVSGIRYEQCMDHWRRVVDPHRERLARKMRYCVDDLGNLCDEMAVAVPTMSTVTGTVRVENAREYVAQDLQRHNFIKRLIAWKDRYDQARCRGHDAAHMERDTLGNTEVVLANMAAKRLSTHQSVSELTQREECTRAIIVLNEVQGRRNQFWLRLAAAQVYEGKNAAVWSVASIAAIAAWAGLPVAAVAQAAYSGHKLSKDNALLTAPEREAWKTLEYWLERDVELVRQCMLEAGCRNNLDPATVPAMTPA